MEALLSAGALDVFTAPIGMKKSRPGVLLTCLCREEDREKFVDLLFRHIHHSGGPHCPTGAGDPPPGDENG